MECSVSEFKVAQQFYDCKELKELGMNALATIPLFVMYRDVHVALKTIEKNL